MNPFDEIRPYNDVEVVEALRRIVKDEECLSLLGQFTVPKLFRWFPRLVKKVLSWYLRVQIKGIQSIDDFQRFVERYLSITLEKSSQGLTVVGIDKLDLSKPYLFVSNHRDITLDPALTNYALYHNGGSTVRIAIGDNLLSKPFVSDLMRANKSFIVKRSLGGPRELLKSLKLLSQYIWHSLSVDNENIWIAQREGRSKDGFDKSDPAIIKMLTIAKPKGMLFSEYVKLLRIVPVSVSYEYDPCDVMKARELRLLESDGEYSKSQYEDLSSIGAGISGLKGSIVLTFGHCLSEEYENAQAVADALDDSIAMNYRIQSSNVLAYELLHGEQSLKEQLLDTPALDEGELCYTEAQRSLFHRRIESVPDEDTVFVLQMYANPIVNRLQRFKSSGTTT